MKFFIKILASFVFVAIGLLAYFSWEFAFKAAHPSDLEKVVVDVQPGESFYSVVESLREKGLNIPSLQTKIWTRLTGSDKRIKVGEFELELRSSSAKEIIEKVLEAEAIGHKITIQEGLNLWDIEKIFAEAPLNVPSETFWKWVTDPKRLERMGVPSPTKEGVIHSLEGYLFPNTYLHYKYSSPEAIIDQMLDLFEERVSPLLQSHRWAQERENGEHQLLTLASIVEKESGDLDEQPTIASVYWNRIKKGMRLQADPTTIYGLMPDFDGNIRRVHLRQKNAYNTYMMKGLPAGPIANPGAHTVEATLNPASTDYLFFVSKNDGTHIFSETYKEHNRWVDEYQRRRRSKK